MSAHELLPSLTITPGTTMHFYKTPTTSYTEVISTGSGPPLEIPPHWHKLHGETWDVIEGRVNVRLGQEKFVMKAGDPQRRSTRRMVHSMQGFKGERLVIREATVPGGEFKQAFFRDMMDHGSPGFLYVMRAFSDGDTYPHLGLWLWVDELFLLIVGFIARVLVPAKRVGATVPPVDSVFRKDK